MIIWCITFHWWLQLSQACSDVAGHLPGEQKGGQRQISLSASLEALSLGFLDKSSVTGCQGKSAASLILTVLQILILLSNAYISKFTLIVINQLTKLLEWLDFAEHKEQEQGWAQCSSSSLRFPLLTTPPMPRITSARPSYSLLLPPDSPGAGI